MAVTARAATSTVASASASATLTSNVQQSPHVAVSTVTGLILGVMCLFILVVSYQLIPWLHRKPPKPKHRTRILVAPPPEPKRFPLLQRYLDKLITFVKRLAPRWFTSQSEARSQSSPRSLHQPSQDKPNRRDVREKFLTQLRLHLHNPPAADVLAPRTPKDKKRYAILDDGAFSEWERTSLAETMEKPASAVLSPWSAREQDFPYASSPTPSRRVILDGGMDTPPTPPPAYMQSTPIRGGLSGPVSRTAYPVSPSSRRLSLVDEDPFADSSRQLVPAPGIDPFADHLPPSPATPRAPCASLKGNDPFADRNPIARIEDDLINLSEVIVVEPSSPPAYTPPSRSVPTTGHDAGAFVIADEGDSMRSSMSSTWSATTLDRPM